MEEPRMDLDFEKTLADAELLLKDAARSSADTGEYSLEDILREFGKDAARPAGAEIPEAQPPQPVVPAMPGEGKKRKRAKKAEEPPEAQEEAPAPEAAEEKKTPDAPTIRLQDVMAQTVQSALEEDDAIAEEPKRRGLRRLFSRRMEETETLYVSGEPGAVAMPDAEEAEEDEPDEPDPPLDETAEEYGELCARTKRELISAAAVTLLMWIPLLLSSFSLMPALYEEEPLLHLLPYLIAEASVCLLGRDVFVYAAERLAHGRFTYELFAALGCLISLADGVECFFDPQRAAAVPVPLHALGCVGMLAALLGRYLLFRALYANFRAAEQNHANYIVTITSGGAAKRCGGTEQFINCAHRDDIATRWQVWLLPVLLTATLVFALLSTLQIEDFHLFLWNWSLLLLCADSLAFPLAYALPFFRISGRITKNGAALAGYAGADAIRRSNCVILTDGDLFPPGTLNFNGLKLYGENSADAIAYAATLAHGANLGISWLFDELLKGEDGQYETLSDLNFYEEGGVMGTIRGETVLLGTEMFCRKMKVTLPRELTLKTGVFLAVDGVLTAVFAVKYMPAENVSWALHAIQRNRMTGVLAVRDGNITPALLKRKFGTGGTVYPKLFTRLALSEKEGGRPYALLFREGLMPYAEAAVGSKRLCRAVRSSSFLSFFGSVCSMLIAFYFAFVGAYTTLTLPVLLLFLLLWGGAAMLNSLWVTRY